MTGGDHFNFIYFKVQVFVTVIIITFPLCFIRIVKSFSGETFLQMIPKDITPAIVYYYRLAGHILTVSIPPAAQGNKS